MNEDPATSPENTAPAAGVPPPEPAPAGTAPEEAAPAAAAPAPEAEDPAAEPTPEAEAPAADPEPASADPEPGAEPVEHRSAEAEKAEAEAAKAEADKAKTEAAALKDRLLRLQADFDNFRKRQARERAEWIQQSNADLLEELLPVLDQTDAAIASVSKDSSDAAKPFREGFELVRRTFLNAVAKFGL